MHFYAVRKDDILERHGKSRDRSTEIIRNALRQIRDDQSLQVGKRSKRPKAFSADRHRMETVAFLQCPIGNQADILSHYAIDIFLYIDQATVDHQKAVLPVAWIVVKGRIQECAFTNGSHATRDRNAGKIMAVHKCATAYARHFARNREAHKTAAIPECRISNARHAVADHDARQSSAAFECIPANARHAIRDHNALEMRAVGERIIPDARHSLRQDHVAHTAHSIDLVRIAMNIPGQRNGILITKIFDQTVATVLLDEAEAVCCVHVLPRRNTFPIRFVPVFIHDQLGICGNSTMLSRAYGESKLAVVVNDSKTGTTAECPPIYTPYTIRNRDADHTATAVEGIITNARHTIRNRDICKASATGEGVFADTGHAVGNLHSPKATTTVEHPIAKKCHIFRERDACKVAATGERGRVNDGYPIRDRHTCQTTAIGECTIPDAGHALRDRNALQAATAGEGITPYAGHAIRKGDALKTAATRKCAVFNARHTIRDRDLCQGTTAGEVQTRNAIRKGETRQTAATGKNDSLNAIGDLKACQSATIDKAYALHSLCKRNAGKAHALGKVHVGQPCRDVDAYQALTSLKRKIADVRQAIRKDDMLKPLTIREGPLIEKRDALRDLDFSQAFASAERTAANHQQTARQGNALQIRASIKGATGQLQHTFGNRSRDNVLGGKLHRSHSLVVKDPISQNKMRVFCRKVYIPDRTSGKRGIANRLYALTDRNRMQGGALYECIRANLRHAIRDHNVCQCTATAEYGVRKACYPIRDGDALKAAATEKGCRANARHTIRNLDRGKLSAILESVIANTRYALRNYDADQIGAIGECICINARHTRGKDHVSHPLQSLNFVGITVDACRQGDGILGSQVCNQPIFSVLFFKKEAVLGSRIFHAQRRIAIRFIPVFIHDHPCMVGNTAMRIRSDGKRQIAVVADRHKSSAAGKRFILDHRQGVGQRNARKTLTTIECPISNRDHIVRNDNIGKTSARVKRIPVDALHTARKRNIRKMPALSKAKAINTRHSLCQGKLTA